MLSVTITMALFKGVHARFLSFVSWNICVWLTYKQLKSHTREYYAKPAIKIQNCDK